MNLSDVTKVFEDLTGYIQQGDTAPFENLFTDGHISVNVPRYGQIGNNIVFGRYLRQVRLWHRYVYMSGDSGARHDRVSIKDDTFFAMPINLPSSGSSTV